MAHLLLLVRAGLLQLHPFGKWHVPSGFAEASVSGTIPFPNEFMTFLRVNW